MSPRAPTLRSAAIAAGTLALTLVLTLACYSASYPAPGKLGVLPPAPPRPLWLGAVRPEAVPAMHGAAAITAASTPNYSHVLVSIWGAVPGQSYAWTLHSGSCGSAGATIPVSGSPLVAYPDGTAKAEGYAPQKLSPGTPYAVVIGSGETATPPACADLSYGTM